MKTSESLNKYALTFLTEFFSVNLKCHLQITQRKIVLTKITETTHSELDELLSRANEFFALFELALEIKINSDNPYEEDLNNLKISVYF